MTNSKLIGVPAAYLNLIIELSEQRCVDPGTLLEGLDIDPEQLARSDGRVPQGPTAALLMRAITLTRDPGLGFAIGLGSQMTSHGFVGLGLTTFDTLRGVLAFGQRFVSLRTPFVLLNIRVDGDTSYYEVTAGLDLGPLRQCVFELFLSGLWRMANQLAGERRAWDPRVGLCFDFSEPPHFADYRDQLPDCEFNSAINALRIPTEYLDLPIDTADRATAQLVTQRCEQELTAIGGASVPFTAQVRAILDDASNGYPSLEPLAEQLRLSSRSLKRRLKAEGSSFQRELDAARLRRAKHLLRSSALSISEIAQLLGYREPANFTRAFRKWSGLAPSCYRDNGD